MCLAHRTQITEIGTGSWMKSYGLIKSAYYLIFIYLKVRLPFAKFLSVKFLFFIITCYLSSSLTLHHLTYLPSHYITMT